MPRSIVLAFAFATCASATLSAIYWFRSAAIPVRQFDEPKASVEDAPQQHILTAAANADILHGVMNESAKLNKNAAVWTGVAALFGALTTVAGVLG